MPTYEYRCPEGHQFERFYRKISDAAPELACPECGKLAVRQLSGGAGFVFKGSGFYLTDYGKNAHRKTGPEGAGTGESKSKPGDSGAAESKAVEAKPEPKSESKPSDTKSTGSAAGGSSTAASTPSKPASGRSSSSSKSEK
jgi:putative FmdB family regulatory protein